EEHAEVLRSAEELRTRTVRAPRERVRIRKQIVSEVRTVEVPVRVERLVVEHEPLDGAAAGPAGENPTGPASAEPLEIVLHEEVPVVSLRVQPVEVVRVGVRTVQDEEVVEVDLRSEQVVVEQEAVERGGRPVP
ncbi:YsnF/AvaK domain-containing protein, partial [Kineococcus sp. G2]|uniref:YsnF/AvaK domain-containing protein n=1 Tax=Kineococcus sp. G2 TaxID=3127484 RepID=UPI00301DBAE4